MFLFARELTGSIAAAFIGGLLFAFAPYRIPQSSHLQVLSSQWMPFVLYGFRRYFDGGRIRALVGATAAAIVQGLSCGYYLLYFSPFAALYVLYEMWRVDRLGDRRTWLMMGTAALVAMTVTAPFVMPYLRVSGELQLSRSLPETTRLSADVYSYATASGAERFWGSRIADVFRKPEGELFPGAVPVLLALIGLLWSGRDRGQAGTSPWRRRAAWVLLAIAVLHTIAAATTIVFRRLTLDLWLFDVRLGNVTQLLLRAAIAYAIALGLSPRMRERAAAFMRSRGFFVAALGASHYTYVEATLTQTVADWLAAHVRSLEYFGGVPRAIVPDNLKSGVRRPCRYEPDLNPSYQDFAEHYGVAILPARVRKPRDKAIVAVGVQALIAQAGAPSTFQSPIRYDSYLGFSQTMLILFCAAQAPASHNSSSASREPISHSRRGHGMPSMVKKSASRIRTCWSYGSRDGAAGRLTRTR